MRPPDSKLQSLQMEIRKWGARKVCTKGICSRFLPMYGTGKMRSIMKGEAQVVMMSDASG